MIRASTHFYNTETDIDRLAEALGKLLPADVPLRVEATDVRMRLIQGSLLEVYVRRLEMKQFDNRLDPSTAHLWVVDLATALVTY
jgi:hypothetical protein